MSQENVDVYFAAKDRLAAGDHDGFTRLIHPDVTATVANFPEPGPFLGRDALIAQLEGLAIEFHGHRYSDVEIIADRDGWIVLTYRWSVQGSRSGAAVDADVAVAFRVKDRQVIEVHWRESRDEALDAAGLGKPAMSQENVETVRQIFAAWDTDDLEGFVALLDDELVTCRHPPMPDPGTWHGRAGALDLVADWLQSFDDFIVRAEEFIDAPDHVVVRTVQGGRGSGGGVPVTGPVWFVCGLRGGKLVTWDIYGTREQALEAAGLQA